MNARWERWLTLLEDPEGVIDNSNDVLLEVPAMLREIKRLEEIEWMYNDLG